MRLVKVYQGAKFTIWAIDRSEDPTAPDCPDMEFLEHLEPKAKKSLVNVMY